MLLGRSIQAGAKSPHPTRVRRLLSSTGRASAAVPSYARGQGEGGAAFIVVGYLAQVASGVQGVSAESGAAAASWGNAARRAKGPANPSRPLGGQVRVVPCNQDQVA